MSTDLDLLFAPAILRYSTLVPFSELRAAVNHSISLAEGSRETCSAGPDRTSAQLSAAAVRLLAIACCVVCVLSLLGPALVVGQVPLLGLDFSVGIAPEDSLLGDWLAFNGGVLFVRVTNDHRNELWFTDGTALNTRLILEGWNRSEAGGLIGVDLGNGTALIVFDGVAGFGYGRELWLTDGTADGTALLQDFCPGSCDGFVTVNGGTRDFQRHEDAWYFIARPSVEEQHLYRYRVAAGLELVHEGQVMGFALSEAPLPGPAGGDVEEAILLLSQDAAGTATSLRLLRLETQTEQVVASLELSEVVSMQPFRNGSLAVLTTATTDRGLYFVDHNGLSLLREQIAVTPLLRHSAFGEDESEQAFTYSNPSAVDEGEAFCDVLVTHGSVTSTRTVTRLVGRECWTESVLFGNRLAYTRPEALTQGKVFATNTAATTILVLSRSSESEQPSNLTALPSGGLAWLDQVGSEGRLLTSSGSLAGATVAAFDRVGSRSFSRQLPTVGNDVLLVADNGNGSGAELWRSDLTSEGSVQLANLTVDRSTVSLDNFVGTRFGLAFNASENPLSSLGQTWFLPNERVLLESLSLSSVSLGAVNGRLVQRLRTPGAGDAVTFVATEEGSRGTLFTEDEIAGTVAATLTVADRLVIVTQGIAEDAQSDARSPDGLWLTDGGVGTDSRRLLATPDGDRLDSQLHPVGDLAGADAAVLAVVRRGSVADVLLVDPRQPGPRLLYRGEPGLSVLGVTDEVVYVSILREGSEPSGSEERLLQTIDLATGDLRPSLGATQPVEIGTVASSAALRGRLLLVESAAAVQEGGGGVPPMQVLRISDGTTQGTVVLGTFGEVQAPFLVTGGLAFFSATTALEGPGLYATDGTVMGTRRFDASSSNNPIPGELFAADARVLLSQWDANRGAELSLADVESGELLHFDIEPGAVGSGPEQMEVTGPYAYFEAFRSDVGREIFTLDRLALRQICQPSSTRICLGEGRFAVEVEWLDRVSGDRAMGTAAPFRADTGRFWFFDPDNIELVVKVLDARSFSNHWWVFFGALTDVNYWLTVTDLWTGQTRSYTNEQGNICGVNDTLAFRSHPVDVLGDASTSSVQLPPVGVGGSLEDQKTVTSGTSAEGVVSPECGPTVLCLRDERFRITVDFQAPNAQQPGVGQAVQDTDETGYFWFFNEPNIELALKVVDGRPVNGNWWVFFGGLSDVEYTVTVVDSETGGVQVYENEQGSICGQADTSAFPTAQ